MSSSSPAAEYEEEHDIEAPAAAPPAAGVAEDEAHEEYEEAPIVINPPTTTTTTTTATLHETDVEQALVLKSQGNSAYAEGKFLEAIDYYTDGLEYLDVDDETMKEHWAVFHGNRAACFVMLGDHERAVTDCTVAIEHKDKYLKVYKRRARAYEQLKKYAEAQKDLKVVCEELDPTDRQAAADLARVSKALEQQLEEQKAEMLGKLKEMGNSVLGKFGLSLDNFKTVQDPKTGSYSISFDQGGGGGGGGKQS